MQYEDFQAGPHEWNRAIARLPNTHLLQTWQWAEAKVQTGWESHPLIWKDASGRTAAAAMLLLRRIPLPGLSARPGIAYVPKGPLLDWPDSVLRDRVLRDLQIRADQLGAVYLKIDPDVPCGTGSGLPKDPEKPDPAGRAWVEALKADGWHFAPDQIQFRNTILVDLAGPDDKLLAQMKQKTRYNVRLSARKGVEARAGEPRDFEMLYDMYAETALRDDFVIRPPDYYRRMWQIFWDAGMLAPLIAEVEGDPVAAVVIFRFAGRAWYLQGMSTARHREKMPNYLLQWEAMRRAKIAGCSCYDLWGAPDDFVESDPMWGVFRFKQGLGGYTVRHIGAWDKPIRPFYYRLYTRILPRILDLMRSRGKALTRSEYGSA